MTETGELLTVDFYPKSDVDFVWEVVSVNSSFTVQRTVGLAQASLIKPFSWAERFVIRRGGEVVWPEEVRTPLKSKPGQAACCTAWSQVAVSRTS